jgi:hypothetical protein
MSAPKRRGFTALVLLLAIVRAGIAAEYDYEDAPPDVPIDERPSAIEKQLEEELPDAAGPFTDAIRRAVRGWAPVLADSTLSARFRSYYMYGKLVNNSRREAWAYGGWLRWKSGRLLDRIRFGLGFYTSQPIHAPSNRGGTQLLRPRQRPFSVFGETYAAVELAEGHELRLYRQLYDIPYLNKRDNRMTPNSFEAYSIQGGLPASGWRPGIQYIAGWVSRIKERNSDRFRSMAEQAGAGDAKRGLAMAGVDLALTPDVTVGVLNHHVPDVLNIFYSRGTWTRRLSDELALSTEVHYTHQRSTGDDLLIGSSFDTYFLAGFVGASYRGATLSFAMSTTSDEQRIRSPYGSRPSPVDRMLRSFDRADEQAWDAALIYSFKEHGLPQLTVFGSYTRGTGARNPETRASLPDQSEVDLTADYHLKRTRLRGLWVRLRGAFVNQSSGSGSQNELRIILNYDWPVLGPTKRLRSRREEALQ